MGVITTILLVFFVIIALVLILMVMLQDEQGDGLGGIFGGGGSTPFGTRSGNVLTKFTSLLGVLFIITSLGLAFFNRTADDDDVLGAARKEASEESDGKAWWQEDVKDDLPESVETLELPEDSE